MFDPESVDLCSSVYGSGSYPAISKLGSISSHSNVFIPFDFKQFGPGLIFGAMSPFSDWKDWFPVLCVNVWRASTTVDLLVVKILE